MCFHGNYIGWFVLSYLSVGRAFYCLPFVTPVIKPCDFFFILVQTCLFPVVNRSHKFLLTHPSLVLGAIVANVTLTYDDNSYIV